MYGKPHPEESGPRKDGKPRFGRVTSVQINKNLAWNSEFGIKQI